MTGWSSNICRVIGGGKKRIRHLATVVVHPKPAHSRDAGRVFILERNVKRSDDVIVEIGRDAARVIPVLAEPEESIRIEGSRRAGPSHCFQSM